MNCYRHPEAEAGATCVACEQPICEECREEVAGHPMCHPCVAAAQARLSQPLAPAAPVVLPPVPQPAYAPASATQGPPTYAPAGAPAGSQAPGLGRRILRGMLWGIWCGQCWTLYTILSSFVWSFFGDHISLDADFVFSTVIMAVIFGFFGSLAGLVIGAVDAPPATGMAIGVGTGILLCLLQMALSHSAGGLINLIFYYFTGRLVGLSITVRVQQPV